MSTPRRSRPAEVEIEAAKLLDESEEGTIVILNLARALLARSFFIVHSIATIWNAVKDGACVAGLQVCDDNSMWGFVFISITIVFEGAHSIIMRAGIEAQWSDFIISLHCAVRGLAQKNLRLSSLQKKLATAKHETAATSALLAAPPTQLLPVRPDLPSKKPCPVCGVVFCGENSIERHVELVHPTKYQEYYADEKGKKVKDARLSKDVKGEKSTFLAITKL
ncbi:unnamed protein product [Gongylonema pulchrum]|uniref:C2H2-type domain-containing protein n=1 Tax=Gongylonema pulchrum TaxID=637853 RepID=A0A3P7MH53_9BILA|nr:unnamed protein product [Gongylonema pulchrum]